MRVSAKNIKAGDPKKAHDVTWSIGTNREAKTVVMNFTGEDLDIFDLSPDEALEMAQYLIKSARKLQKAEK